MLKKPCFNVSIPPVEAFRTGYCGCIKTGFRYWSETSEWWEYYCDYDYRYSRYKHCLANLYAEATFYGDSSPHAVRVPVLKYESKYSLSNPGLVAAMARTLKVLSNKVREIAYQNPTSYSEYLREIANFYKIDRVIFGFENAPIPLDEGLAKVDDLAWKLSKKLQLLEGRITQDDYVLDWCNRNGYEDPQRGAGDEWYAYSKGPNSLMPVPIDPRIEL